MVDNILRNDNIHANDKCDNVNPFNALDEGSINDGQSPVREQPNKSFYPIFTTNARPIQPPSDPPADSNDKYAPGLC